MSIVYKHQLSNKSASSDSIFLFLFLVKMLFWVEKLYFPNRTLQSTLKLI